MKHLVPALALLLPFALLAYEPEDMEKIKGGQCAGCTLQIGLLQIGTLQIGTLQIGPLQLGFLQLGFLQITLRTFFCLLQLRQVFKINYEGSF